MAVAQEKRPEIRAAKLRVEQARSLLRVVEGEYYPAVSLVGSYGRYGDSPRLDGSAYKSQEDGHLMAVANWTFWEWGRTASRAEAGLSRQRQAENILQNVRDQVALEVKSAYLLWREALKQVGVSREAIEQAKENYRINQERYREQVGTATEVIDAQTLLAKANHDYYAALSEAKIHLANLKRAMGVGLAD
jgi:outer membrane protein TolC